MRKIVLALVSILGLSVLAFAAPSDSRFTYPQDSRGQITGSIDFVGCDTYFLVGTSVPVMVANSAYKGNQLNTPAPVQPVIVYGLIFSTSAMSSNDYVILRDSTTLNRTAAQSIVPNVYPNYNGATGQVVIFPVPIYCQYGLSAAYGAAAAEPSATTGVSILFRKAKLGK